MQNTLPLNPGNPLRNVTGLAKQIALPGEHAPLRFPSFPALERTAVMGFNTPATINTSVSQATSITVFRQACYPVWADQDRHYFAAVDYAAETNPTTAVVGQEFLSVRMRPAATRFTSVSRAGSTTQPSYQGTGVPAFSNEWPVLGRDINLPGPEFMYVPDDCAFLGVMFMNAPADVIYTFTINFERWTSPGQSTQQYSVSVPIAVGARGAMFTVRTGLDAGEWIRPLGIVAEVTASSAIPSAFLLSLFATTGDAVTYTPSGTSAGLVTITSDVATQRRMNVPLTYPAEFRNSILPWYATRVTAASFLGTNVTQVLNKSGTVLGGRVSPARVNAWECTYDTINNLHPAEKAYLPLETGIYTYCPPSTDLVFFTDYTRNTGGFIDNTPAPIFSLSNDSMYNKMFLSTPSAVAAIAGTVTWHIEFRTSSALFQVGLSAMTLESLHQAQLVLAENGFFFENPEHEKLLQKVINTAKKYAPAAIGTINPMAGKLLQSFVSRMATDKKKVLVPKKGPSKPAATSATASGIVNQKKGKPKNNKKGKK